MQFHVVVHGANEEGATEKIKRVLATVRITPDLLHWSGPGKPLLIKRRFSKAQASRLRDQLTRLGIESSILTNRPAAQIPLSPDALKRVSQQIQALFKVPAKGLTHTQSGRSATLSSRLMCARVLIRPLLDMVLLFAICFLLIASLVWLTAITFAYSFLLGMVLVPLVLAAIIKSAALLAFFVWPRQSWPAPRMLLKSQDDPRLILFASAICQLVKAPQPATVLLTMDSHIHAGLEQKDNKPTRSRLEIPLPLLQSLTLAELACVMAGTCANLGEPATHKPYGIIDRIRDRLRSHMERELDLNALREARLDLTSPMSAELLGKAIRVLQVAERWRVRRICSHLELLNTVLATSGRSRSARQWFWGGSTSQVEEKVGKIRRTLHQLARLQDLTDSLLSDQVAASIAAECPVTIAPFDGSIVQSQGPAGVLVKGVDQWDKALSRLFYQSLGLDLSNFSLLSRTEVLKRRQRDEHYRQIAEQYFSGWLRPRQFWQFPAFGLNQGREPLPQLNRCIARLRSLAPERNELIARQERLQQQVAELQAAKKVFAASGNFKFTLCPGASADVPTAIKLHDVKLRECGEELFHQNSVMGERLMLGLTLAQQRGARTGPILNALSCIAKMRPRLEKLHLELSELELLSANRSAMPSNSFSTYQRELLRSIDSNYQLLARQLERCPYNFCDPGIASLGHLLQLQLQQQMPRLSSDKAQLLLRTIDDAYEKISQRAAGIAGRVEQDHKIERIKRLQAFSSSDSPRE